MEEEMEGQNFDEYFFMPFHLNTTSVSTCSSGIK